MLYVLPFETWSFFDDFDDNILNFYFKNVNMIYR